MTVKMGKVNTGRNYQIITIFAIWKNVKKNAQRTSNARDLILHQKNAYSIVAVCTQETIQEQMLDFMGENIVQEKRVR